MIGLSAEAPKAVETAKESESQAELNGGSDINAVQMLLYISLSAMILVGTVVVLARIEHLRMKKEINRLEDTAQSNNRS